MKEWTNSAAYNAVAWVSVAIMIGLTLALASITIKQMMQQAKVTPANSTPVAQVQSDDSRGHAFKADIHESRIAHLIRQTIGIGKLAY
jgi:hypothetical protein